MNERLILKLKQKRLFNEMNDKEMDEYDEKFNNLLDKKQNEMFYYEGLFGLPLKLQRESLYILHKMKEHKLINTVTIHDEESGFNQYEDDHFKYFGISGDMISCIAVFANETIADLLKFAMVSFEFFCNSKILASAFDGDMIRMLNLFKLTHDPKYLHPLKYTKEITLSLYANNRQNVISSLSKLCEICKSLNSVILIGDIDQLYGTTLNKILLQNEIDSVRLLLTKTNSNQSFIPFIQNILKCHSKQIKRLEIICDGLRSYHVYNADLLSPELVKSVNSLSIQYTYAVAKYLLNNNENINDMIRDQPKLLQFVFGATNTKYNGIDYSDMTAEGLSDIISNNMKATKQSPKKGRATQINSTMIALYSKYDNIFIQKDANSVYLKKN